MHRLHDLESSKIYEPRRRSTSIQVAPQQCARNFFQPFFDGRDDPSFNELVSARADRITPVYDRMVVDIDFSRRSKRALSNISSSHSGGGLW